MKKINSIQLTAKEWFDRANGNSYFSARIYIDHKEIARLPFQYGYGDHYVDMCNQYLIKNNIISGERHDDGSYPALWRYCEENKIQLYTNKQEKCLKRDVIAWGE